MDCKHLLFLAVHFRFICKWTSVFWSCRYHPMALVTAVKLHGLLVYQDLYRHMQTEQTDLPTDIRPNVDNNFPKNQQLDDNKTVFTTKLLLGTFLERRSVFHSILPLVEILTLLNSVLIPVIYCLTTRELKTKFYYWNTKPIESYTNYWKCILGCIRTYPEIKTRHQDILFSRRLYLRRRHTAFGSGRNMKNLKPEPENSWFLFLIT